MDWLIDGLTDLLTDWLTDWFFFKEQLAVQCTVSLTVLCEHYSLYTVYDWSSCELYTCTVVNIVLLFIGMPYISEKRNLPLARRSCKDKGCVCSYIICVMFGVHVTVDAILWTWMQIFFWLVSKLTDFWIERPCIPFPTRKV